ncbi:putative DNA helicase [Dactylonectria macrodidyma]|uniref:DNA helicase n=1 Tax=Dactylonectria macrodidyma TaxID=307937 RepID=A0A9P9JDV5_9HYPO|nr:putative DNA helicase [Dactylonectria macrodidyma]
MATHAPSSSSAAPSSVAPSVPASVPGAKAAAKPFFRPCAIMLGGLKGHMFGGKGLGSGSEFSVTLVSPTYTDATSWMGFGMDFPLGTENEKEGFGMCHDVDRHFQFRPQQTDKLRIMVRFPRGKFSRTVSPLDECHFHRFPGSKRGLTVVDVSIEGGAEVEVDGFGLPFANSGHPSQAWLRHPATTAVVSDYTLLDVIQQRSFTFVVDHDPTDVPRSWNPAFYPPPFTLPYGKIHDWNPERYPKQLADNRGPQFLPCWGFDNDDAHLATLTQAQVQDVWPLHEATLKIKKVKLSAYFVDQDNLDSAKVFFIVVPLPDEFQRRFEDAWRRLANGSPLTIDVYGNPEDEDDLLQQLEAKIQDQPKSLKLFRTAHSIKASDLVLVARTERSNEGRQPVKFEMKNRIALTFDAQLHEFERKVNAVCMFHPKAAPTNPLAFGFAPREDLKVEVTVPPELMFRMSLHRDLVRGKGFWNTMRGALNHDENPSASLEQLSIAGCDAPHVPSPLPTVNLLDIKDRAYVDALMQEVLVDDRERFERYLTNRPLGLGIITGAPGFGKTTALALATLGMAASLGNVYGTAPTHVATDNFAARLDAVTCRVTDRYNQDRDESSRARRKLIIRVYKELDEYHALCELLKDSHKGDEAAPSDSWRRPTRWKLGLSMAFWALVCLRSPGVRELHDDDSTALHKIQDQVDKNEKFGPLRDLATGNVLWEEFLGDKSKLKGDIVELFHSLISATDIICTPPALAHYYDQLTFWRDSKAQGIAVDEAGNMVRQDLYSIWGNTLLPCVLAGDDQQLAPVVSTLIDNADGNCVNRFGEDAQISPLAWFKGTQWPIYRLHTQLRMAIGQFEICHREVYKDLPYKYGECSVVALPGHSNGRALESYINAKYPDITPAPAGTLRPIFLNCQDSFCQIDRTTKSKRNFDQVKVALDFICDFIQTAKIDPAQMVIITPYKANVETIARLRKKPKYAALSSIQPAATVDSFQGQEGDIAIIIMGTNKKVGPGFTTDERRLNVMLSRQKSGLVVVGDINVTGLMSKGKNRCKGKGKGKGNEKPSAPPKIVVVGVDGQLSYARVTMLQNIHDWFCEQGRVIDIAVKDKDTDKEVEGKGKRKREVEDEAE